MFTHDKEGNEINEFEPWIEPKEYDPKIHEPFPESDDGKDA